MLTAYELRCEHLYNENVTIQPTVTLTTGKTNQRCKFYHLNDGRQCRNSARENGYCGAHASSVFLTTAEAASILKVTSRKVLAALNGEPDLKIKMKGGGVAYAWHPNRVASLIGKIAPSSPRKPKDYSAIFARKYKEPQAALPLACEIMFNLNRYAKHAECQQRNVDEIYMLKNEFLGILIEYGLLQGAWRHTLTFPSKPCFRCDGTGYHYDSDAYGDEGEDEIEFFSCQVDHHRHDVKQLKDRRERCLKCNGSGIYLQKKEVHFACLRFMINGKQYTWHQPAEKMNVQFEYTEAPSNDKWTRENDKPLTMCLSKFAEGKALIRWIVNRLREDIKLQERI